VEIQKWRSRLENEGKVSSSFLRTTEPMSIVMPPSKGEGIHNIIMMFCEMMMSKAIAKKASRHLFNHDACQPLKTGK
jgi:hypothetical protein